jgi:hypothetical protein
VFIVKAYWITGSIKNCQRRFVERFVSFHGLLQSLLRALYFLSVQVASLQIPYRVTELHRMQQDNFFVSFSLLILQFFFLQFR